MKTHKIIVTTSLVIGFAATLLLAQEQPGNRPQRPSGPSSGQQGNRPGGGQPGQQPGGGFGGQRPPFPLIDALDANRDNVIDATEVTNATAALKKLDKNNDQRLTPEEFLPQRFGQGRPGGQGGAGAPGQSGQGGQPGQARPSGPAPR